MDQKKQLDRWRNNFEELLNPPTDMQAEIPPSDPVEDDFFLDLMMHPLSKEEIRKALSKQKYHKAGGIDLISNEDLHFGGEASVENLCLFLRKSGI